jgi:hypothetical protein
MQECENVDGVVTEIVFDYYGEADVVSRVYLDLERMSRLKEVLLSSLVVSEWVMTSAVKRLYQWVQVVDP